MQLETEPARTMQSITPLSRIIAGLLLTATLAVGCTVTTLNLNLPVNDPELYFPLSDEGAVQLNYECGNRGDVVAWLVSRDRAGNQRSETPPLPLFSGHSDQVRFKTEVTNTAQRAWFVRFGNIGTSDATCAVNVWQGL